MLPAISADLPAYLMPPTTTEESQGKTPDANPATKVDIRAVGAASEKAGEAGTGLYGPDGQYVEAAGGRVDKQEVSSDGRPSSLDAAEKTRGSNRDIPLEGYDAAIPPAAKEELMALADRASRRASQQELDPREYERIARLMSSIGRYDEARVATVKAEELQSETEASRSEEQEQSSRVAPAPQVEEEAAE